jgi:hypothetical protein
MGNNASAAVDELSEELASLLETTSLSNPSKPTTREELYSFFDDGFDDDAEEIISGAKTPARMGTPAPQHVENYPQGGYFSLPIKSFRPEISQYRPSGAWSALPKDSGVVPETMDEGYCSAESEVDEMELCEEDKEALLPAKRFSWRASSPERCSLLYWEK